MRGADSVQLTSPVNGLDRAKIDALVGAKVDVPAVAELVQPPLAARPTLTMYTRAADAVEAGTRLALGGSLDVKG